MISLKIIESANEEKIRKIWKSVFIPHTYRVLITRSDISSIYPKILKIYFLADMLKQF